MRRFGLPSLYSISFEADVPSFAPGCNISTGSGCVMPPAGAAFYPFFSTTTTNVPHTCFWQFGGGNLPQTVNKALGSDAASQFGGLMRSYFPTPSGAQFGYFNFHRDLSSNPCQNLGLH